LSEENGTQERIPLQVRTPGYKGPERRIIPKECLCHHKHTRILEDHDGELRMIKSDLKDGFKQVHDDLAHRREILDQRITNGHREIWDETKILERGKVSNKLFYTFITVYSVLFIAGIIAVYTGMHNNALTFTQGISDVKIMQTKTDAKVEELSNELQEVKTDVKDLIKHNGK
jgi:cell division protein FtsL